MKFIAPLSLCAAVCLAAITPALAQPIPPYPQAGHALSDLHAARDILANNPRGVNPNDQQAISLIDKVIFTTDRLRRFDESRLHVHEPYGADAQASSTSHHENARIMLAAALHDLDANEVDPAGRPYLQQARYQLGEAIEIIRRQQMGHR